MTRFLSLYLTFCARYLVATCLQTNLSLFRFNCTFLASKAIDQFQTSIWKIFKSTSCETKKCRGKILKYCRKQQKYWYLFSDTRNTPLCRCFLPKKIVTIFWVLKKKLYLPKKNFWQFGLSSEMMPAGCTCYFGQRFGDNLNDENRAEQYQHFLRPNCSLLT